MLNTRPEWTDVVKDLKKGDVVLVLKSNLPRGKWLFGRSVDTYPGIHRHSLVTKVQSGQKAVVRPIHNNNNNNNNNNNIDDDNNLYNLVPLL